VGDALGFGFGVLIRSRGERDIDLSLRPSNINPLWDCFDT
jgi:hypothetical protein